MRSLFVLLLCLAFVALTSHAQSGTDAAIAMVGKWSATESKSNGAGAAMNISMTQSMKFSGSAKMDGKEFWTFSGTWEVQGNEITWHYDKSSRALADAAKTDTDEIISVDAEKMVLRSKVTGQRRTLLRAN